METFSCQTKIISGPGSLNALGELGSKRLFVVADPFFEKTDVPARIVRAAGAQEAAFFYEVLSDPTVELAAKGTASLQRFAPDAVVALGGGSAMDCAKAMVYFAGVQIPLAAIPTTSGSGSEVTDFAILTHNGTKHPLVDKALLPRMAILDGELLHTLPKKLIADAGFDIVAHAVESYVATNAGAFSKALACDAFATACTRLPASYHGNTQVRLRIHEAATMAGLAFARSGLGLCHAMAHALGGRFHLAHGRLNAILLPAIVEVNSEANPQYAALARDAGIGGAAEAVAVRNLRNTLTKLRKELQLPQTLAQAGIPPREVAESSRALTQAILADPCCQTNPVQPNAAMVHRVLSQVTGIG